MLTALLLLFVLFVLIIKYAKQVKQKIAEEWRFIKLINKLPGPSFLQMLAEVLQFRMDRERMFSLFINNISAFYDEFI